MEIYIGERGSGKTTKLIEEAERTGATIVSPSAKSAWYVEREVYLKKKKILHPMSVTDFIDNIQNRRFSKTRKFVVDELQVLLSAMNIEVATCDKECLRVLGAGSSAKSQPDRYINATQLIATLEGAIERTEREEPVGIEKLMAVTSMKYAKRLLEEESKTEDEHG
nr:MAG TPA: Replicase large subunit [Caudoviricetes sp.]